MDCAVLSYELDCAVLSYEPNAYTVLMCMIWTSHSSVAEFPALMGCDAALLDK